MLELGCSFQTKMLKRLKGPFTCLSCLDPFSEEERNQGTRAHTHLRSSSVLTAQPAAGSG